METSSRQLKNRYHPIQPIVREGNTWTFASETSNVTYTTTRAGSKYLCTCPARGLCKHIESAILEDAREKFGIVQVWTSEQDALRQKRRKFQIRANRRPAWVTVGAEIKPEPFMVRRGWGNIGWTLHYHLPDGKSRVEHAERVNLAGFASSDGLDWYREAA